MLKFEGKKSVFSDEKLKLNLYVCMYVDVFPINDGTINIIHNELSITQK